MVPSLNKYTLKNLSLENLSMLVGLVGMSQKYLKIEVGGTAIAALTELIKSTTNKLDLYLIAKFLNIVKDNGQFVKLI